MALIGPEVRAFRFAEETGTAGTELGWHEPGFDDEGWSRERYSIGPYWLVLGSLPGGTDVATPVLADLDRVRAGVAVDVAGGLAFVIDSTAGLRIIDIGTPSAPVEVGSLDTPGLAADVRVSGPLAYVADGSGGLRIIDVSTPTSPAPAPPSRQDVRVVGGRRRVAPSAREPRPGSRRNGVPVELRQNNIFVCLQ